MSFPNWHDRPEQFSPGEAANGKLDGHHLIQMADQFISLANKRNRKVDATEIQMVMLFAAARYAAHFGKNVIELPEQEEFIKHMAGQYADMLRGIIEYCPVAALMQPLHGGVLARKEIV